MHIHAYAHPGAITYRFVRDELFHHAHGEQGYTGDAAEPREWPRAVRARDGNKPFANFVHAQNLYASTVITACRRTPQQNCRTALSWYRPARCHSVPFTCIPVSAFLLILFDEFTEE